MGGSSRAPCPRCLRCWRGGCHWGRAEPMVQIGMPLNSSQADCSKTYLMRSVFVGRQSDSTDRPACLEGQARHRRGENDSALLLRCRAPGYCQGDRPRLPPTFTPCSVSRTSSRQAFAHGGDEPAEHDGSLVGGRRAAPPRSTIPSARSCDRSAVGGRTRRHLVLGASRCGSIVPA